METSNRLECKYMIAFPIIMLFCSAIILWATLVVGFSASTITGIILLILGVLMLMQPVIVFKPGSIEWKSLIGRTGKVVKYQADTIEVKDNKVFVDGQKQMALWQFNVNADTLKTFLEANRSA